MPKPLLLLVFQDCYDCGVYKAWHEKVQLAAAEQGVLIKYTPHNTPGAKQLILEAHEKGVKVPFLTNGKRYSRTLEDLVKNTAKTSERMPTTEVAMSDKCPKTAKKKEVKHGDAPKTAR